MEEVKEHGDEELYSRLDSTYLSDDEGTEVALIIVLDAN